MRNLTCLATALLMTAMLFACDQPGPAERAGRSVDRAAERVRDAVDPPNGPAERAGRAIDRAVN